MYQATITERESGQRFDKYLQRILPNAGSGFLHKMLRKKNITLNDRKADGSEKTAVGDCVKIFFAQETLDKFMGKVSGETVYRQAYGMLTDIRIIFENDHILIADKPAGVLSQKAEKTDVSLNEWLIGYLLEKGSLSEADLSFYKPSVCNRLDRNTSGMVLCAKTLQGAQFLSTLLKDRILHKYYQLYVKGHIEGEHLIKGYLVKDEKRNKVVIKPVSASDSLKHDISTVQNVGKRDRTNFEKSAYIQTKYKPLKIEADKTLLDVELITGKPHQIRAHLASIGHPLLGDYKYGDRTWNEKYRKQFGVKSHLLHAYKVVFPTLDAPFADLSGRTFVCEVPEIFGCVSNFI